MREVLSRFFVLSMLFIAVLLWLGFMGCIAWVFWALWCLVMAILMPWGPGWLTGPPYYWAFGICVVGTIVFVVRDLRANP
jgi:hypothetical protein